MASSRIFVKGLPPTMTEVDFKKHFSQKHEVTDTKIFPNRRIGYVGYKTPEDAQKAVKYFRKTFIRMSRIDVELARTPQELQHERQAVRAPTAQLEPVGHAVEKNERKRKRTENEVDEQDPKLKEFLEVMRPKNKKSNVETVPSDVDPTVAGTFGDEHTAALGGNESDSEYEHIPQRPSHKEQQERQERSDNEDEATTIAPPANDNANEQARDDDPSPLESDERPPVSDLDWARSKTSRLLGLLDDDEEEAVLGREIEAPGADSADEEEYLQKGGNKLPQINEAEPPARTQTAKLAEEEPAEAAVDADQEAIRSSQRLFLRNLPYDVKATDLETEFLPFGNLEEVHVPLDPKTGLAKGFAYVQFSDPDSAEAAMRGKDGQAFQGRLLHILPAQAKRETKLDDFALSKLPLKKQQQIKRKREAASTTFNWNALYMNADAVVSSVADRLGLAKSEVLDPTSSDAAIKQAHAETHIIQETKAYFKQQGIDLDAFKRSSRGNDAILVKNIPYDCGKDELQRLFEEHGELKKFIMPPSGTLAIVGYGNAAQCGAAFGALAYRKIKNSVLFLERAPKGIFDGKAQMNTNTSPNGVSKTSASDFKDQEVDVLDTARTATLFVRNLNFSTTTPNLMDTFRPLEGFLSARVKTRTDPKKPGQVLSMGFGFVEFRTASNAGAAIKAMDGYALDGHKLQIRASHKGADAAEERRRADSEKRAAGKKTKVVIKNLPFEATKKDIRALFGAYGQLRSVRVPRKMDRAARGFAFADFTTSKEAESAIEALKDTHLLGRRLVLDFAAEDADDAEAEIEKMQQKVGAQVNKVALQKLTSGGRKKFTTMNDEETEP